MTNVLMRGVVAVLGIFAADGLELPPAGAAALVSCGVLSMRFGRLFVAPFAQASVRGAVVAGFLLSAAGLAGLAVGPTVEVMAWAGVIALGVGYGAIVLAIKVQLVGDQTDAGERLSALSRLAIALNLGAAVGPVLAGLALSEVGSSRTFFGAAVIALTSAVLASRMPSGNVTRTEKFQFSALRRVADLDVAIALASVVVAFAFYAQLASVLPLVVNSALGVRFVGLVFVVNAVVVMAAQIPVTRLIDSVPSLDRQAGPVGLVLFVVGFATLAVSSGIVGVVVSVVAISLAECVVLPFVERYLADRLAQDGLAVAFTLSAVAMGVGETLGSLVGVSVVLTSPGSFTALMALLSALGVASAITLSSLIHRRTITVKGIAP
ncbi:MFS transporter [Nocardioides hungaricus]